MARKVAVEIDVVNGSFVRDEVLVSVVSAALRICRTEIVAEIMIFATRSCPHENLVIEMVHISGA